ncbi:hypothetical protein LC724_23885 [Blautia sp. RD014234]|nr:hypothetical protein [Blautia parvula]
MYDWIRMDVAVSTIVIIVMHGHFCLFVDFGTHQRRASQILIRLRGRFGRYLREPSCAWVE